MVDLVVDKRCEVIRRREMEVGNAKVEASKVRGELTSKSKDQLCPFWEMYTSSTTVPPTTDHLIHSTMEDIHAGCHLMAKIHRSHCDPLATYESKHQRAFVVKYVVTGKPWCRKPRLVLCYISKNEKKTLLATSGDRRQFAWLIFG
jgi:hypothetical protein